MHADCRQARGSRRAAQVGRRWGAQAGTWADASARGAQAAGSRRRRHGRASAGRARARMAGGRGARQGRGSRRGAHGLGAGRAACAHRLGQLGAHAPGLVSNLVFRLGIFPESPNEHCSL